MPSTASSESAASSAPPSGASSARTYELAFIVEPRTSDEEVEEIISKYKERVESNGAVITHVDNWGKRKLAYAIQKVTEGRYIFFYITADGQTPPFPEIERLMRQDDKVLRYLTVRTDQDLKRAASKGKVQPPQPGEGSTA